MLRGHDSRAERSPERAGRGGVKTLPMKIPGAEREELLEIFCPRQDLCRERTTPVRNHRVNGRTTQLAMLTEIFLGVILGSL